MLDNRIKFFHFGPPKSAENCLTRLILFTNQSSFLSPLCCWIRYLYVPPPLSFGNHLKQSTVPGNSRNMKMCLYLHNLQHSHSLLLRKRRPFFHVGYWPWKREKQRKRVVCLIVQRIMDTYKPKSKWAWSKKIAGIFVLKLGSESWKGLGDNDKVLREEKW